MENEVNFWLLPRGETVFTYGDPTRRMFVLKGGYCDLYNSENTLEKTIGPGSQLGLLEMTYCLPKKYTVVTRTDCLLFYFDYSELDDILKLFPKEYSTLESVMFQKDLLESVAKLEMIEDTRESSEVRDSTEKQPYFINIANRWPNYCEVYRQKLGPFWCLGFVLIPMAIYPDNFLVELWCIVRAFLIVLQGVVITAPLFADEISWIGLISQITLYLDMYLSLHIGYYDGNGRLKVHPMDTSWHYLTHGFLIDLISAVPWQYFMIHSEISSPNKPIIDQVSLHPIHCFWNLLKLLQFYKVFKCISYFEHTYFKRVLKLLRILLVIILTVNISTSVGISYICQSDSEGPWLGGKNGSLKWGDIKCRTGFLIDNWNTDKSLDTSEVYTVVLYIILDWLTNSGIGDSKPSTITTKCAAILIILFGFYLFVILTSFICTMMLEETEETLHFRDGVSRFLIFLENYNIDANLKKKVLGHFDLLWDRTKGFNIHSKAHFDIYFRDKLLMNHHERIFHRVPLLCHFDMSYVRLVLEQVHLRYFQKGEVIVRYKDVLSDLYIVTSGQVEIFSKTKEPLCLLGPAAVFGNIRKNKHSSSTIHVEARRNVELWVLNTQFFFNTVKYYPLIVQELGIMLKGNPAYLVPVDNSSFDVFSDSKDIMDELESDEEPMNKTSSVTFNSSKRATRSWTKFSLEPNHIVFEVISFLTFVASLANVIVIPYVFVTQDNSIIGYIYLCFEPIFYIRIFFKLHQSFTNIYGNVITSNRKICKRYLNSPRQFFWDIAPNLPVDLIYYSFPAGEQFFFYTCLRLFHLLRFYYIAEFFQVHIDKLYRRNRWFFFRLAAYYCISVHILACTWFMIACPFNDCMPGTWITQMSDEICRKPAIYKIVISYYYILDIFTTTGIGEVSPKTYMETVFTLITMLMGKIFISVIIGTALKATYSSNKYQLEYGMKLNLLKGYLKDRNISDFILEKTSSYLKNIWLHERGFLDPNIIDFLSYPLQQDLTFALYGNQLEETFLFKDIDQRLLLQICTKLKRTVYFKDDYIVKTGEVNSLMYFVHTGNVIVLTKHPQLTETKHVILHPVDVFGVSQGLEMEESHKFCYRAATPAVEILSLRSDDWLYLLSFFPKEKQQIFYRVQRGYGK